MKRFSFTAILILCTLLAWAQTLPADSLEPVRRNLPPLLSDTQFAQPGSDPVVYKEVFRPRPGNQLLPIYLLAILPVFSLFSYLFRSYISENFKVIANARLTDQVMREREFANSLPGLIMLFLFSAGIGALLSFHVPTTDFTFIDDREFVAFLVFTALWPLLYGIRALIYRIFNLIFRFNQVVSRFRFQSEVLFETAGFILFPFICMVWMAPEPINEGAFRAAVGILLILAVSRWLVLIRTALGLPGFRLSYFLLYFCSFEIAPVLILYAVLAGQSGVVW